MLSPRRTAQLCLTAATLTLVTTFTVLVAGSLETPSSGSDHATASAPTHSSQVTPLATGQLDTLQAVSSVKR